MRISISNWGVLNLELGKTDMTEANLIGILILFQIKSHKIEEAETKMWAERGMRRERGPALSHSFFAGGLEHRPHGPTALPFSGMSRSGGDELGFSQPLSFSEVSYTVKLRHSLMTSGLPFESYKTGEN